MEREGLNNPRLKNSASAFDLVKRPAALGMFEDLAKPKRIGWMENLLD
jgi:hypothetical protein